MSNSTDVADGDDVTAAERNALRADAIKRDCVFVWEVEDAVPILDEQGGHYIVPEDMTIYKIGRKLDAGTCTIRLRKKETDGDLVTIEANIAVDDTYDEQTTSIDVTTLLKGEKLILDITDASSASGLLVNLYATRNL